MGAFNSLAGGKYCETFFKASVQKIVTVKTLTGGKCCDIFFEACVRGTPVASVNLARKKLALGPIFRHSVFDLCLSASPAFWEFVNFSGTVPSIVSW